jgi:hypothetical protein
VVPVPRSGPAPCTPQRPGTTACKLGTRLDGRSRPTRQGISAQPGGLRRGTQPASAQPALGQCGPCAPCSRSPVGRGRVTTAVCRRRAALSHRAQCPRLTKRHSVPVQPLRRVSTTHHRRHRARLFPSIDEGPTTRHPCPHVGEHRRCVSILFHHVARVNN